MTDNSYSLNSDLARTVATTASVLVSSTTQQGGLSNSHRVLMANGTFQKAIGKSLSHENSSTLIRQNLNRQNNLHHNSKYTPITRKNPPNGRIATLSRLKDFNILPQDLLDAIPDGDFKNNKNSDKNKNININENTQIGNKYGNNDDGEGGNGDASSSSFSLFQGFNATLPEINEKLERLREDPNSRLLLGNGGVGGGSLIEDEDDVDGSGKFRNPLPGSITEDKIKTSQNARQLNTFRNEINYKLDLIEIRKTLSSNEIHGIDSKIETLYQLRKKIFDRIARFEQDESYLEDQLSNIESRLQLVKDVEPSNDEEELLKKNENAIFDDEDDEDSFNSAKINKNEGEDEDDDDEDYINVTYDEHDQEQDEQLKDSLLSKSIHLKLKKKFAGGSIKKRASSRRHKPTLQQYYKPGDSIKNFKAHEDSITCLSFDVPFGTMVTASVDNTVRVWDMNRYKCTGLLEGHMSSVRCMQMQDNLLMTGSQDATLKLWDLSKVGNYGEDSDSDSGPLLKTFESHVDEVTALSFSSSTLVSGSSDKTIRQWDLATGYCMQTIDILWASSMMMNSQYGSGGGHAGSVSMMDSTTFSALGSQSTWQSTILTDTDYPFIGALQCYDAALASGTADGIVRLWDLRSGEVIRQLIGHTGPVTCLQFDDKNLTTGSADRSIRIWDLRTGGILDSFAYDSPITSLQFDASKIVSSNRENTVKIYDRIEEKHWTCGEGTLNPESTSIINCLQYQEGYLVEGDHTGSVGVWAI